MPSFRMTAGFGVSQCQSDKNTMNEPLEAEAAAAAVQNSQTARHVCCCNYFSYLPPQKLGSLAGIVPPVGERFFQLARPSTSHDERLTSW